MSNARQDDRNTSETKQDEQPMADQANAAQQKPTDRSSPGRGPTNADSGESGRERRNTEQRSPKDGEV
jgi:hypothetical protein